MVSYSQPLVTIPMFIRSQGYDDGGSLSDKLRKNGKAIVLLDEIEKAHPDVLTVFLQVFDDGRITDTKVVSSLIF